MRRPRWSLRRAGVLMSSKFVLIIGLVGFVALIWLVELVFGIRHAFHLPAFVAIALAGVPMVLWLAVRVGSLCFRC